MRLLLVEDDPLIRISVTVSLEGFDLEVVEAASAEQALALFDTAAADVLITDVDLGKGLNGIELADRLQLGHPWLPVVFVTGSMRALGSRPLRWNEAFLAKPFDVSVLAETARKLASLSPPEAETQLSPSGCARDATP